MLRLRPALLAVFAVFALALAACDEPPPAADAGGADAGGADAGAGGPDAGPGEPTVILPRIAIEAAELAVLVNEDDPLSVALGDYYMSARGIPAANRISVRLAAGTDVVTPEDFAGVRAGVEAALPAGIEGYAITWTQPYRVGCMSITSAFALGYDDRFCNTSGGGCSVTDPVDYFSSPSTRPFEDHGVRPAMMLAATSEEGGRALIDRGVAGDDTFPGGDGYLVRTDDEARSVRYTTFPIVVSSWEHEGGLRFTYLDNADGSGANAIMDTSDVLFYFTGLMRVPDIATNTYLPGAVADHLTSFGGQVPTSGQMSVMEWIDAGVTASYGTVVEPCNYTQKFPHVPVFLDFYFRGATVLEAYWKSVRWPGEGLFVGEPLARPWGAQAVRFEGGEVVIETNALAPSEPWAIESADSEDGPWAFVQEVSVSEYRRAEIRFVHGGAPFYRLVRRE